jgi:hypothetical protein
MAHLCKSRGELEGRMDETITRLFMTAPFALASRFIEGIFESSRLGVLDIEHVTPERFANGVATARSLSG